MEKIFHRKYPYRQAVRRIIVPWAIGSFVVTGVLILLFQEFLLILAPIVIVILTVFKALREHEYFIEKITIENDIVHVHYLYCEEHYQVSGPVNDFKMRIQFDHFNRFPKSYLHITFRHQSIIRQYQVGSWKWADMRYFDTLYPKYVPGPDEVFGGKIRIRFLGKPFSDD